MDEKTLSNRLFIAVEPSDALQERISRRRPELRNIRWIAPERLHLTLAFIGALPESLMQSLDQELGKIHFAPFELELNRIGTFSRRTLWLGCEPPPGLQQLHRAVHLALQALEIKVDPRPYQPHITLAYSRTALAEPLIAQLERELLPEPMAMAVDQFMLKNSILNPGSAPLHQTLRLYNAAAP